MISAGLQHNNRKRKDDKTGQRVRRSVFVKDTMEQILWQQENKH
jgi:hypothetical protein